MEKSLGFMQLQPRLTETVLRSCLCFLLIVDILAAAMTTIIQAMLQVYLRVVSVFAEGRMRWEGEAGSRCYIER